MPKMRKIYIKEKFNFIVYIYKKLYLCINSVSLNYDYTDTNKQKLNWLS